jgi:hypothetical protein
MIATLVVWTIVGVVLQAASAALYFAIVWAMYLLVTGLCRLARLTVHYGRT